MTEQEVLDLINQFIVSNGNNEITADVLRPILEAILQQPNELIGNTSQLQTVNQSNLVSAINEVYQMISNIGNTGVKLYEGLDDPNVVPPPQYNIADFYIEKDSNNNPIALWQYNGSFWKNTSDFSSNISRYGKDENFSGSQDFNIEAGVVVSTVLRNRVPLYETEYSINPTTLKIVPDLFTGDTIGIRGIIINP